MAEYIKLLFIGLRMVGALQWMIIRALAHISEYEQKEQDSHSSEVLCIWHWHLERLEQRFT